VDLVCTDLVMPGNVNGWMLALDIWQRTPAQKILFCSELGLEEKIKSYQSLVERGNLLCTPNLHTGEDKK
jgi:hypothetical protein